MSSEIAASFAGRVAGALDRAHEHRRAPPRWSRTPATSRLRRRRRRACRLPPSARPRRGRSRRPSRARRANDARADRHHHQVLDVDAPPRMRAAAEDLDLGQRQRDIGRRRRDGATAARRRRCGGGLRDRERHRDRRVAAEARLVRRAVELRSASRRPRAGRARRGRRCAARSAPLTLASARATSSPPKREPPSRRSTASREPRDAPAGRDRAPRRAAGERDLGLDGRPAARIPDAAARGRGRWSCRSWTRGGWNG